MALANAPTLAEISRAVEMYMEALQHKMPFAYGHTRIPLNVPTFGAEEVIEALDSMMTTYVTMGKKVKRFEEMFAQYVGTKNAIMTNSGSSANLLVLNAIMNPNVQGHIKAGDEVITPALTWATTVFPIAQAGLVPVLADVNRDTYCLDPQAVEDAITPRTRALMPVHLLGNVCDMDALMDIAKRHNLWLIEDTCEAHGAEWKGKKVGSFGDAATFSFFFSHHISTVEGGMVMTDNAGILEACRGMRAFGWIRDLADKNDIAASHPNIDPRFLFEYAGFNFRPTEMQGAFGIHQLPRLEGFIVVRRENAEYWNAELGRYSAVLQLQHQQPNTRHAWFSYPVCVRENAPFTAKELMAYLEGRGLECRPIEAGNMDVQPAMKTLRYRAEALPHSQYIHSNAFFWGNHAGIGQPEREAVASYVHEFMKEKGL